MLRHGIVGVPAFNGIGQSVDRMRRRLEPSKDGVLNSSLPQKKRRGRLACTLRFGRGCPECTSDALVGAARASQRDGFAANALGKVGWVPGFDDVNLPAQRLFEIEDKVAEIEDRTPRVKLHEQVDVAAAVSSTRGHGSKNADTPCAMHFGNSKKLIATSP